MAVVSGSHRPRDHEHATGVDPKAGKLIKDALTETAAICTVRARRTRKKGLCLLQHKIPISNSAESEIKKELIIIPGDTLTLTQIESPS